MTDTPKPDVEFDAYGNEIDGDLVFCTFPDCGCACARVCPAENAASGTAIALNIEPGSAR